jgi:hypothetical protein
MGPKYHGQNIITRCGDAFSSIDGRTSQTEQLQWNGIRLVGNLQLTNCSIKKIQQQNCEESNKIIQQERKLFTLSTRD